MPYSNLSDLLNEFLPNELARLSGNSSGGAIDENRVNFAIQNADELINSFLLNRYSVPISSPIPALINVISRELAISNLYEYSNHQGIIPPNITRRRNYALFLLRQIQSGEIRLNLPDAIQRGQIYSNKDKTLHLFDSSLLDKFVEF
ncbi:MAG: phage protein Gp36 family protein [Candidatus Kapaibacteriales bacterium]